MNKVILLLLVSMITLQGCINDKMDDNNNFSFQYNDTFDATFQTDSAFISIQQSPLEIAYPDITYKDSSLAMGEIILDFTVEAYIPTQQPHPHTSMSITGDSLAFYYSYYPKNEVPGSINMKATPTVSTPPARPTALAITTISVIRNPQFPVEVAYVINR